MAEYIEREAAMSAFLAEPPDAHYPGWYAGLLENLPAADVAPVVHGRWVPVDEVPPCGEWRCMACGNTRIFVWDMSTDDMRDCYVYCPNCGARMDGDSDETS